MPDEDTPEWRRHWEELGAELKPPGGETAIPSQNAVEEKNRGGQKEGEPGEHDPNRPSTDFAALIDAIKKEGVAYRKEEQREDRGKKFREWTTIVLIAMTFVAVCWQVHEMIKVYGPIKLQADAAQKSAEAASQSAVAAKEQAEAMTKQAETSAQAIIGSQRAWVGPTNATFGAEPAIGKPIEVTIQYQNTGREPALAFRYFSDLFPATIKEQTDGTVEKTLSDYLNACREMKEWSGGSVIYPISGTFGGGYNLNIKSKDDFVDEPMTKGDTLAILRGCFAYRSVGMPHHSYFCFFYKQGQTKIQNLSICPTGHYAD